jgi:hypothetical protein
MSLAAAAQEPPPDIRVVNGLSVDLAPLNKWLVDRQGDRPLKHWMQIQVGEIKEPVATWQRCVVKGEIGELTILLDNLPQSVIDFLQHSGELHAEIRNLTAEIESKQSALNRAGAKAADANNATGAPTFAPNYYVIGGETAKAQLEDMRTKLEHLQARYSALMGQAVESTTVLAMNTGRTYSNLPIWDCGAKK